MCVSRGMGRAFETKMSSSISPNRYPSEFKTEFMDEIMYNNEGIFVCFYLYFCVPLVSKCRPAFLFRRKELEEISAAALEDIFEEISSAFENAFTISLKVHKSRFLSNKGSTSYGLRKSPQG